MIGIALSILCLQAPSPAARPAPPDPEAVARDYVPLLGDPAHRERALDRLAHAGRPVLALLESRGIDEPTLSLLRETVELHAALGESYGPPRLFTFDGKEQSLGALLSRFEVGSGMTFHKHAVDLSSLHSLSLKDATFWQALDALAKKVPFTYQPYLGDQLYLNAGPAGDKPLCYHGPFRVALDRVILKRRVGFDRTTEELSARLHILWENHVSPLGLTRKFRLTRAEDDTGASLFPTPPETPAPEASRPVVTMRVPYETLDVGPLRPLSAAAKRISALEGTLGVEFPSRVDKVVFEKPGGAAEIRPLEGVSVELRSFAAAGSSGVTAEFVLRFRDEKEAAAHRASARDVTFVPLAGTAQPVQVTESRIEKGVLTFSVRLFRVAATREIKEIVLRIPRGIRTMDVPFRYRDVELR